MAGKYVEDAAVKEIFQLIKDNYAKQDGAYENLYAGNLSYCKYSDQVPWSKCIIFYLLTIIHL